MHSLSPSCPHSPLLTNKRAIFNSLHSPLNSHHPPIPLSHLCSLQSPLVDTLPVEFDRDTVNLPWISTNGFKDQIFTEEPPWLSPDCMPSFDQLVSLSSSVSKEAERKRYNELRRRQVKVETEAWARAAEEYKELEREMLEKRLAPSLPYVKSLFLGWFEPLRDAIKAEQRLQRGRRWKAAYATHIGLLPAEKMAVIVMHKMMGLLMVGQEEECVRVVQAAVHIGDAIEQEVRICNFLQNTKRSRRGNIAREVDNLSLNKEQEVLRHRVKDLLKKRKLTEVHKVVKRENNTKSWGRDAQAKLGSRLIELLIESAFVQPPPSQSADIPPEIRPAFRHLFKTVGNEDGKVKKRFGVIECDPLVQKGLNSTARHMVIPYMPMLIPPKSWKGYDKGGHLFLPSYVMRTHGSKEQQDAVKGVPRKQLQKVFQALDTLGSTKWRVNKRVLDVIEILWSRGGGIAGLINRENIPIPEKPNLENSDDLQKWRWSIKKAKKVNCEMHALRCDIELKLSVARKMKDEEGFYYPHNLDFRGRAYPMHSHLNHLSSDLCRGMLEFSEGRPLGKSGLHWLKIHLANLYGGGVQKLSYDGRLAFVENNLRDIFDSAANPVDGKCWWINAEDPFQCLAACINLSDAMRSSSPHEVISHLPIHQDGSCNGLQHYAALGRDSMEAAAVNLVAGDKPADVYSGIAARVLDTIRRDSMKDPATDPTALLAKLLVDQ